MHVQLYSWPKVQLPPFSRESLGKVYEYGPGKGYQRYKSNSFVNNQERTKERDRSTISTIITKNKQRCSVSILFIIYISAGLLPSTFLHDRPCGRSLAIDPFELHALKISNPCLYSGSVFKAIFMYKSLVLRFYVPNFISVKQKAIE